MAGIGRLWLPCLMCLTFSIFSSVKANCNIESDWQRVWWGGIKDSGDILLITFEGDNLIHKIEGSDDANADRSSLCENDESFDTDDGHLGTTASYQNILNLMRFCIHGIFSGDVIIYRESEEKVRTSSYTVATCQERLGSVTSVNVLIPYNFNFPSNVSIADLPLGRYIVNYKQGNGNAPWECDWDISSSYIQVTNNYLQIRSCYAGTSSYELPLNIDLRIIGELSDERIVDLPESVGMDGGMLVLGYQDSSAPGGWQFYIARYGVDIIEETYLEIYFVTSDPNNPIGYTDLNYLPTEASFIHLAVQSAECESNPCQNGGECLQVWLNYVCQCEPGYAGRDCEEDVDDCSTTPCGAHGTCEDGVATFVCHCEIGWGNTRCDELDPCYVNPCVNSGECFKLSETEYLCDCLSGFTGPACEIADVCMSNPPCVNGGTCYHSGGNSICVCTAGWMGETCAEIDTGTTPSPTAFTTTTYTGPSTTTPEPRPAGPAVCSEEGQECVNGDCVDYLCECDSYWTGPYCERVGIWFIVSIALIVLLALLLIIILVVCCVCCSGDRMGVYGGNDYNDYATMESSKSEMSLPTQAPPPSLQFNTMHMGTSSNTYDNVLN